MHVWKKSLIKEKSLLKISGRQTFYQNCDSRGYRLMAAVYTLQLADHHACSYCFDQATAEESSCKICCRQSEGGIMLSDGVFVRHAIWCQDTPKAWQDNSKMYFPCIIHIHWIVLNIKTDSKYLILMAKIQEWSNICWCFIMGGFWYETPPSLLPPVGCIS